MALTLTLREGHDFFVGDRRYVLSKVVTPMSFVVEDEDGHRHVLSPDDWATVEYKVRLSSGIPRKQDGKVVRVMVEAPGKKVLRGDLYREALREGVPTVEEPGTCSTCQGRGTLTQQVACEHCGGHGCDQCGGSGYVNDTFVCPDCGGR